MLCGVMVCGGEFRVLWRGAPFLSSNQRTSPFKGCVGSMARILGRKDHGREVADRDTSN
jgi:hypothetical protein